MSNPTRKVVVVGAGPGGLASAMLLAASGAQVTIVERRDHIGGRTSTFEQDGFRWDYGPTFFLYPRVLSEILAAAGYSLEREVPMARLVPQYRLVFGQGGELLATGDHTRMEEAVAKLCPADAKNFQRFMWDNRDKLQRFLPFLESPFESWRDLAKPEVLKLLPILAPWRSLDAELRQYFSDERIRLGFSFGEANRNLDDYLQLIRFESTQSVSSTSHGDLMVRTRRIRIQYLFALTVTLGTCRSMICSAQVKFDSLSELAQPASFSSNSDPEISPLPDFPQGQPVLPASLKSDSLGLAGPASYAFPPFEDRRMYFMTDLLGPGGFIAPAFQALADQTFPLKVSYPPDGYPGSGAHPEHGLVPEWREGFSGYSKRYASRFGMGLIGTTTRYGLGELLHQDVSYHPCQCTGTLPRAFHAITQAFIAHTASGRSVPSIAAFVSPFIAAEVGTVAWYPARYNISDALRTSTALYLAMPIKNLMKERERQ